MRHSGRLADSIKELEAIVEAIRNKETGVAAKPCAEQLAMAFYIVLRVMTEKDTINLLA